MLVDSLIVPECLYRPGSFSGLMTVYESNFIKLRHLIPTLDALSDSAGPQVSSAQHDCDLHFRVMSRERYTTTLNLTYWFAVTGSPPAADPDLTVRIYHDARLAEAVAAVENHRHAMLRELAIRHSLELGRRWRRNIMLNKWLDYLLENGHGFA
jgi:uncharacterized protein YqiB (DUF1249 family)